jgi:hypothetical protein
MFNNAQEFIHLFFVTALKTLTSSTQWLFENPHTVFQLCVRYFPFAGSTSNPRQACVIFQYGVYRGSEFRFTFHIIFSCKPSFVALFLQQGH